MAIPEPSLLNRIATERQSAEDILAAVQAQKKAQLASEPDHAKAAHDLVAPRTQVEKKLAEIWCELFALDAVGIHDNFFELGGYSLLAMQVLACVRDQFHVELPLSTIFAGTFTIAGLAQAITAHRIKRTDRDELGALSDQEIQTLIEQAETAELATILEELDNITDDELQALLDAQET